MRQVADQNPCFGSDAVKHFSTINRIYLVLDVVTSTQKVLKKKETQTEFFLQRLFSCVLCPPGVQELPNQEQELVRIRFCVRVQMIKVSLAFPPPALDVQTQIMSQVVLEHLRHVLCLFKRGFPVARAGVDDDLKAFVTRVLISELNPTSRAFSIKPGPFFYNTEGLHLWMPSGRVNHPAQLLTGVEDDVDIGRGKGHTVPRRPMKKQPASIT
jgi:hypothetical protein